MMKKKMKDESVIDYKEEDLIWEAVRRKESYKRYYYNALNQNRDKESIDRLRGFKCWPKDQRFMLSRLFDPSCDIHEIKNNIIAGTISQEAHPYWDLSIKKKAVLQHAVPGRDQFPSDNLPRYQFKEDESNKSLLIIDKSRLIDRVVISIDPLAKEEVIKREIEQIRDKALSFINSYYAEETQRKTRIMEIEAEAENAKMTEDEEPSIKIKPETRYHRASIKNYIAWLHTYDKIIDYCKSNGTPTDERNGAVVIRANRFEYKNLVENNHDVAKIENHTRDIRRDYKNAIKLIQQAPHIKFSPDRTPKA